MDVQNTKNKNWIISQEWKDVLFLNYKCDQELLSQAIPDCLDLDTYSGQAYISVVPFRMEGIRFPFSPRLPFSHMWELNLRTYVTYKGKPGIYFFTLDTDHVLAQWIATTFFHLPYRCAPLRGHVDKLHYNFEAKNSLSLKAKLTVVPLAIEDYHHWLVERYCLYTDDGGSLWRGDVIHEPWPLRYAQLEHLDEGLCEEFFPRQRFDLDSVFYAPKLPVYFKPFTRLH